jgi:hypothetical protein
MQIKELVEYRRNFKGHTGTMASDWITQQFLKYEPQIKNNFAETFQASVL